MLVRPGRLACGVSLQSASNTLDAGDVVAPVFTSAAINGTVLVLTYGEALNESSTPATTDYTIGGIAAGSTVSSVVVSTTTVTITMAAAAISTDTVTVSYTAGANPIEDAAGNAAANLTTEATTNNTATAPGDVGSVAGWWRGDDITGIDGAAMSAWADNEGSNNFASSSTDRPLKQTNEINGETVAEFDGSDDNMQISSTTAFNYEDDDAFTVCLVLHPNSNPASRTWIIGKGDENDGWAVESGDSNDRRIMLSLQDASGAQKIQVECTTSVLTSNVTVFMVLSYDGSNLPSGMEIYRNAIALGKATVDDDTLSGITTTNALEIGSLQGTLPFDGQIAEVIIFDEELTSGEVTSLYDDYINPKYAIT